MKMVERIARELALEKFGDWENHVGDALRILMIMREPTEAMIDDGRDYSISSRLVWSAMIDAAIEEGK